MTFVKKNIFTVFALSIIMVLFEVFTSVEYLSIFGIAFMVIISSLFIGNKIVKRILFTIGCFILLFVLFLTRSFWLFILAIFMFWLLFRTDDGNELIFSGERNLHPFQSEVDYVDIKVRPQIQQRSLIKKQSIKNSMIESKQGEFYEDQINLNFFGGNTIIDLGNSFLNNGEKTVMIQKIYGRSRIILPRDMGLQINISMLSGSINFESQEYKLQGENFQWRTPEYNESPRRINLMMNVIFGDVEVIML